MQKTRKVCLLADSAPNWRGAQHFTYTCLHQRDQSVTMAVIPHTAAILTTSPVIIIANQSWKSHEKLGGEGMQIQLLTNQWQIFHLFHFPEPGPSFSVIFFRIDISLPSGYLNQKIPDLVFWSPLTSASGSIQSLLTHHFALHSQMIPGLCCSALQNLPGTLIFTIYYVVLCTPTYT